MYICINMTSLMKRKCLVDGYITYIIPMTSDRNSNIETQYYVYVYIHVCVCMLQIKKRCIICTYIYRIEINFIICG